MLKKEEKVSKLADEVAAANDVQVLTSHTALRWALVNGDVVLVIENTGVEKRSSLTSLFALSAALSLAKYVLAMSQGLGLNKI